MIKNQKSVLLVNTWPDPRFERGVARFAQAANWHLSLDGIYGSDIPHGWQGDGCLAQCSRGDIVRFVESLKVPVVNLYLHPGGDDLPAIGEDNRAIGRLAADYYLRRGFRNLAVYYQDKKFTARERVEGFVDAAKAAGLQVEDLLWDRSRTGPGMEWTERKAYLMRALNRLPKPLAVFCIDDRAGIHMIEACGEAGVDVPYQVAVLGVGDMPVAGNCSAVPLSSVCIDSEAVGYQAASMLNELMEGQELAQRRVLIPPTGIVERRSTSTIAVQHPAGQTAVRYMLEHFPQGIDAGAAATAAGLTIRQLTAITRDELRVSPKRILEAIRLRKAMHLLVESDFTIDGIAADVGITSRVGLERIFRRRINTTPAAWRQKHAGHPPELIHFQLEIEQE